MADEWRQIEALRLEVTRLGQVVAQWTTAAERTEAALDRHGDAVMKLAESIGQHMGTLEVNTKLQQLNCEVVGELSGLLLDG